MSAAMKPKKKPAKRKRSAISGRYGGAKEVEALAWRIVARLHPEWPERLSGSMIDAVKAELLAATTVEERVERVLWRGWVWTPPADFGLKGPPFLYDHEPHGPVDGVERVRLVVDEG